MMIDTMIILLSLLCMEEKKLQEKEVKYKTIEYCLMHNSLVSRDEYGRIINCAREWSRQHSICSQYFQEFTWNGKNYITQKDGYKEVTLVEIVERFYKAGGLYSKPELSFFKKPSSNSMRKTGSISLGHPPNSNSNTNFSYIVKGREIYYCLFHNCIADLMSCPRSDKFHPITKLSTADCPRRKFTWDGENWLTDKYKTALTSTGSPDYTIREAVVGVMKQLNLVDVVKSFCEKGGKYSKPAITKEMSKWEVFSKDNE